MSHCPGKDFDSDEEEGGFTQIGLEMELDVRKPSVPQPRIVKVIASF